MTIRLAQSVSFALYEAGLSATWRSLAPGAQAALLDTVNFIEGGAVDPSEVHGFWVRAMVRHGYRRGFDQGKHMTHVDLMPWDQLDDDKKRRPVIMIETVTRSGL